MAAALARWGVHVTTARSDDEAFAGHDSAPPAPDLLLLDYQLDHGRTAFDALERLEAAWGARPITIIITASASGEAEARASRIGVPVLHKPVEPAELRALINQLRRQAAE